MTHVFIVDDNTFKFHLEYMFAGTGAGDQKSLFLSDPNNSGIHWKTEENLVAMIADISRIRPGDNIVFYLQANKKHEGTIFGVFKAASYAFFDENDDDNYLKIDKNTNKPMLGKGLSYRILIEPYNVFQFGITERELLDKISDKTSPYQLCWSLIYRKLKGNRGCTMIMDYEFDDLLKKLVARNNGKAIQANSFTYDADKIAIVDSNKACRYSGRNLLLDIEPRMKYKMQRKQAFEVHLQAFLVKQIALNDVKLMNLLGIDPKLNFWLGNEVKCGFGMQSIDILIIQELNNNIVNIIPVELKYKEPSERIFNQLDLYVDWIKQYVKPNYEDQGKVVQITPFIIAANTGKSGFLNKLSTTQNGYIAFDNNFLFLKIK